MNFGQNIKRLRTEKNLTQLQLAKILHVNFTYISKIENSNTSGMPSEGLIRGLAQVLDVNEGDLLDMSGHFSQEALKEAVKDNGDVGVLLRRLQEGKIPRQKIKRLLESVDGD